MNNWKFLLLSLTLVGQVFLLAFASFLFFLLTIDPNSSPGLAIVWMLGMGLSIAAGLIGMLAWFWLRSTERRLRWLLAFSIFCIAWGPLGGYITSFWLG